MWLLGNVLSLIGCSLMVCIGFIRRKERVLACQCVQFGFLAAGNLILGAYSGAISGIVSILRNLVFTRRGGGTLLKLGFIAVQVMLTLASGEETLYQTNEDYSIGDNTNTKRSDTVTVTDAQRNETGLIRQQNPPKYLGAIVVCNGADSPEVRLAVVEAVSKVTGLGADDISVLKMK